MQIAIVGLAGSGKTTVFNTLTRGHAEAGGFGGLELHVGVVKVPDQRLDWLAEIFKPKKVVHADVTYVDLPAPPASAAGHGGTEELPGEHPARPPPLTAAPLPAPPASSEGHVGTEELPAEHLARLRESDALLHVVRAFEDPSVPHADGAGGARPASGVRSRPHAAGSVAAARDLERLDLGFILADLSMVDRRLERLGSSGR